MLMSFEEDLDLLTRDERFQATVYAMNSLLISRGIYTREEFQSLVKEWAAKETRKKGRATHRSTLETSLRA
jgi:hypothetical protein